MIRLLLLSLLLCGLLALPAGVGATGFTDIGQDIEAHSETEVDLSGYLRLRGAMLYNLDLDRGPTPSGELFYPVPLADPTAQVLTHADMRLRTDLSVYVPQAAVAIKLRVDVLDNLALGSAPEGTPVGTFSQSPPEAALRIKRAYGEALLPFGVLAAGRMGSHWGLGLLSHGGDCADCDSGDAADRIALITPLGGHVWALAYDFSATGPQGRRSDGARWIDLEPTDDVRTVTFAFMNFRNDLARQRRRTAGKSTVEYGAYLSYRWQENDVPTSWVPVASDLTPTATAVMARDLSALAADVWFRVSTPSFRLEAEGAVLWARIGEPSLIPGALYDSPIRALQYGLVLETEYGAAADPLAFGIDAGFASGDATWGFGAFPKVGDPAPQRGDLQGAQAVPPHDRRMDNFRFHPDYRVDRILFREIIGTVTDAFYFRPHGRWRILDLGRSRLTASLALVASFAVQPRSAPGGQRPLGVELDPSLAWENELGFQAVLDYALLLPLSGLDNPQLNMDARPAQLARLRLVYAF